MKRKTWQGSRKKQRKRIQKIRYNKDEEIKERRMKRKTWQGSRKNKGKGYRKLDTTKMKKSKKELQEEKDRIIKSVPRCLVFSRSKKTIGKELQRLVTDLQTVMLPYSSKKLKVNRKTKMKKIVDIAKDIYVSHFMIVGLTEKSPKLKICRVPAGPTLYCSIEEYSLMSDVQKFFKKLNLKYNSFDREKYAKPAMVVFDGFDDASNNAPWITLTKNILKNMFPAVDVQKFEPNSDCKRVVMFNLRKVMVDVEGEDDSEPEQIEQYIIDFRHYSVEFEDNKVQLIEIGPRMKLKVEKIVNELLDGEVLYHSYIQRSEKEIAAQKSMVKKQKKLKAQRIRIQEENVEKKKKLRKEKKDKQAARKQNYLKRKREKEKEQEAFEEVAQEDIGHQEKRRKIE